jgi:hypothetical protein
VTTAAGAADSATVATAPSSAEASARYWKCRWPSYRNAHPGRCRGFHRHAGDGGWDHRDGDRHRDGGRHHDGDGHHGDGRLSGAVTDHPNPAGDDGPGRWQHDGNGPGHNGGHQQWQHDGGGNNPARLR